MNKVKLFSGKKEGHCPYVFFTKITFFLNHTQTTLADVLETVTVTERLKIRGGRAKIVKMRFEFLPKKVYKQDFKVTPSELLNYFETRFIQKVFIPVLSAVIKDKKVALETSTEKTPKAGTAGSEANEDDEASDKRQEKFEKKG